MNAHRRHIMNDATRYAESERTDPFAYARAATHISIGLAGIGDYKAEKVMEERTLQAGDRTLVAVVAAYKNVSRA